MVCYPLGSSSGYDDEPRGLWYGMVEVCEGAPVAVSGWVLTDMVWYGRGL